MTDPAAPDPPEVIARATGGVLGELVLRRRPSPAGAVHELIVNGVFLMDTDETSTEQLLAGIVLDRHRYPRRVLIGGLGLGVTLTALLADPRPEHVDVVEIEPILAGWLQAGRVPGADRALADPRVQLRIADLQDVMRQPSPDRYDAIVLDVDNGPGFLVHDRNAAIYREPFLAAAARALHPGGLLLVWSSAPAPDLQVALAATTGRTEHIVRWVEREHRRVDYHLYLSIREQPCT